MAIFMYSFIFFDTGTSCCWGRAIFNHISSFDPRRAMLMAQCQTFICMRILLQWALHISKDDIQVSYLELMKLLQCIQLLGNYILVECQITKISNISVLLCNKLWNVSTELFFYPVIMLQLRTLFYQ